MAVGTPTRLIGDWSNPVAPAHWNPLIMRFFEMREVSTKLFEDGNGEFFVVQTREDPRSQERQRLTYRLDTMTKT